MREKHLKEVLETLAPNSQPTIPYHYEIPFSIDATAEKLFQIPLIHFLINNGKITIQSANAAFIHLTGSIVEELDDLGHLNLARLVPINDLRVINEKIIPQTIQQLCKVHPHTYTDYIFSFNYRLVSDEEGYKYLLQKNIFYKHCVETNTFFGAGIITDLSNYKEDSKIIYTCQQKKLNEPGTDPEYIFKNTYLPDSQQSLLTRREQQILCSIYEGFSSKEIAHQLCLSLNTINNHRKNIIAKTGTKNTSELIHFALKKGLL